MRIVIMKAIFIDTLDFVLPLLNVLFLSGATVLPRGAKSMNNGRLL